MTDQAPVEPRILPRSEHAISRDLIDPSALKVLYRLHRAGHQAFMVGGSVRDLMLGRQPKDFDVSTSARPHEVRRLFRNSRIIGRRFRLAHVYFKEGVVEVSTFRRKPDPEDQRGAPGGLLITDDNVFGSPEEDAFRRDFTVNALFYNIADHTVIDYVGGVGDLERRSIRAIGDPGVRMQEDPVRMMRACELAGRLGFSIEAATQAGIEGHRKELEKAATARITDEILQVLRCGHAGRALQWMLDLGVLEVLVPEARAMLEAEARGLGNLTGILPAIDRIIRSGREPRDTALLAALLLPAVLLARHDRETAQGRPLGARGLERLIADATGPFVTRFNLSNQRAEGIVKALVAFHHLGRRRWRPAEEVGFAASAAFDDALLLFELMVVATGQGREHLARWRVVQERRPARPHTERPRRPPRRRRRRR